MISNELGFMPFSFKENGKRHQLRSAVLINNKYNATLVNMFHDVVGNVDKIIADSPSLCLAPLLMLDMSLS